MNRFTKWHQYRLLVLCGFVVVLLIVVDIGLSAGKLDSRSARSPSANERELYRERVESQPAIGVGLQEPPSKSSSRDAVEHLVAKYGGAVDTWNDPSVLRVTFAVGISLEKIEDISSQLKQIPGVATAQPLDTLGWSPPGF